MANTNLTPDIDGYEIITKALMDLLNEYPALKTGEKIAFCTLDANRGTAMFPIAGAGIESSLRDILGRTKQRCLYPFMVVCRVGSLDEARKQTKKEWLDNLGRWLERQDIKVGETTHRLQDYPALTGNRKIREIQRASVSALNNINDNGTEDWLISISCRYDNEF